MRKLRHRKVKYLAQGHTANKCHHWDSIGGLTGARALTITKKCSHEAVGGLCVCYKIIKIKCLPGYLTLSKCSINYRS